MSVLDAKAPAPGRSLADVVAAWPRAAPLALQRLETGWTSGAPRRWTLVAAPTRVVRIDGADPLGVLDAHLGEHRAPRRDRAWTSPAPGWLVVASYDLGRRIEQAAQSPAGALADRPGPLVELHRIEGALRLDHASGCWDVVGDPAALPELERAAAPHSVARSTTLRSATGRAAYEAAVARAIAYVHAGDVFQVNVTHRLGGTLHGDPRDLAVVPALLDARFGGYAETTDRVVVSASPELFLERDATRERVCTRPIKGTRAARDHSEFGAKDRAELVMIVDLMRNDLGRVARRGSVEVVEASRIERHHGAARGVRHTVATVAADVPAERPLGDLLAASFPPGSITGAPKIRAMQIIDELEPVRRGVYCGAIGLVADTGDAALNVAIRTPVLHAAENGAWAIDLAVGAGIVADSDPSAEWRETLAKAAPVARALGATIEEPGA